MSCHAATVLRRRLLASHWRCSEFLNGLLSRSIKATFFSSQPDQEQDRSRKVALVIGSSGCLGQTVSRYLSRNCGMTVLGADVIEMPGDFQQSDWELDGFITIPARTQRPTVAEVTAEMAIGIQNMLDETEDLNTIVVASGGWAGDPKPVQANGSDVEETRIVATEYGEVFDNMINMNLIPVIAAGYTAQRFMGPNGLFVVIGATAALSATPGMMAYGVSKSAAHHVVQTMGVVTGKAIHTKTQRKVARRIRRQAENLDTMSVLSILPTTIDTPSNRQFNPGAVTSNWTKPRDIAKEIGNWLETPQLRPHSGALVRVTTDETGSKFEVVR